MAGEALSIGRQTGTGRKVAVIPSLLQLGVNKARHLPEETSKKDKTIFCSSVDLARAGSTSHIERRTVMRVLVIVPGDKNSESGQMPSQELIGEMMKFNEKLVKAGVMLAGEGLTPTSKGKRVKFSGKERTVIDGPFAESKEIIAGFWIWQVKSIDEAVEWLKLAPFDGGVQIEVRPIFDNEDFGKELTPELRAKSERLRSEIEQRQKRS
jgi:hypothetical protein